ncbi:membrane protein containing DUF1538 [Candidatus Magnetoovum chiemensis]|nr:membrane protein containing DUF1538 [Candidatus Magnetoovum chiemensis]
MSKKIRFADYEREISRNYRKVSYNEITRISDVSEGKSRKKYDKIELRSLDVYRVLKPYLSVRFIAQFKSVAPLAVYLVLFQIIILREHLNGSPSITLGIGAVIAGLMLFMEGLKVGIMPFSETIGSLLPAKRSLTTVLLTSFLLGIVATFAEPAIGALQEAGSIVDKNSSAYVYFLLNNYKWQMVLMVGAGVGLACVVGTIRSIYGISLKLIVLLTLIPALGLTVYIMTNPNLVPILGLAWDCGAVTTGPVTVPLVLALGVGVSAASGKGESSLSGLGVVTLASLFPVIFVLILGVYIDEVRGTEILMQNSMNASSLNVLPFNALTANTSSLEENALPLISSAPWYERTPYGDILLGLRAIVPLVLFLYFIISVILKEKMRNRSIILFGIVLSSLGMILFNLGISYGLSGLGQQSGSLMPSAFMAIEAVKGSPLYDVGTGFMIAVLFAYFLGFGATLAEPALNALGDTVENLTNGAFKKNALLYSVSFGVGMGIAVGVVKIILLLPIHYFILPGYILAAALTFFSDEEFVNAAWDSAGVTTGPVTVPLVLAMGIGLGEAVNAAEGFGILAAASICPIISVLALGMWIKIRIKLRDKIQVKKKTDVEGLA